MTLPEPRGPGPSERRGPRRPPSRPSRGRPSACRRRRLFLPSRLSPPRVCERARGGPVFRGVPGPLRLRLSSGGGRRPSLPPSPLARCVVSRPAGSRSSRPRPERVRVHPALPGVAPRRRACGGARRGPAPALERPARGRRLGTAAWSVGAVRRAGARPSRGGSAVPGGWPLPVPATRRPPPALLSRSSVRVPPSAARSPRRCVGGGVSGDYSRRSLGRPPSAVLVSLPARVLFRVAPLARSLPRVSASLA